MKYKPLGKTGLYVSQLCLGAMTFSRGDDAFSGVLGATGEQGAKAMVDRAIDAGVNFFDTANVYSEGASEELLGKAIGSRRDAMVLATKVYSPMGRDPNALGAGRKAIFREVEASLRRLGTDYIDLYQVHSFDPTTPLEETLKALDDLVRSGKVRYIGCSNFAAWQIAKSIGISERLGLEQFQCVQSYYSLVGRELEHEILPAVEDLGLGVMVWSPLAGGYLSGKYTSGSDGDPGRRKAFSFPPVDPQHGDAVVRVLREVGQQHDASPARVALAWLLQRPQITSVIVGASKMHQLEDNLAAAELELTADELEKLDTVSKPAPLYCWVWGLQRGALLEDLVTQLS